MDGILSRLYWIVVHASRSTLYIGLSGYIEKYLFIIRSLVNMINHKTSIYWKYMFCTAITVITVTVISINKLNQIWTYPSSSTVNII